MLKAQSITPSLYYVHLIRTRQQASSATCKSRLCTVDQKGLLPAYNAGSNTSVAATAGIIARVVAHLAPAEALLACTCMSHSIIHSLIPMQTCITAVPTVGTSSCCYAEGELHAHFHQHP